MVQIPCENPLGPARRAWRKKIKTLESCTGEIVQIPCETPLGSGLAKNPVKMVQILWENPLGGAAHGQGRKKASSKKTQVPRVREVLELMTQKVKLLGFTRYFQFS
jgi:hypothetical protein